MSSGYSATRGHLESNGGIRGHSAGDYFPFVVFAQGTFDALRWRVKRPDGQEVGSFRSARTAGEYAKYLKQEAGR